MIALRDGMPRITLPDGRSTSFDKRWITASLRSAAEHAGYRSWWLAGHITESITVYLKRDFDENCVSVTSLESAVLEVLDTLGFNDVAGHFQLSDPPASFSLTELAREAGEGYELAFFGLLGDRLRGITGSHVMRLEIHGLSDCLKMLSHRKGGGRREGLRQEIVDFIRQHGYAAGTCRHGKPLEIQLS